MAIIPAEEKVFMVSNSTNTTYSGSAALKAMQQWYTMEDVTNTVRPYQVFTALLTQSGGDDPIILYFDDTPGGPDLTIGVTYQISDNTAGLDVTNIGAPNNTVGTSFVATGTRPTNWGEGSLTYNTGAPVATVLENTIGNVWFGYNDVGNYSINSNGLFTTNKTYSVPYIYAAAADLPNGIFIELQSANYSQIMSIYNADGTDGQLSNTPIEIRVYN
jgi:hypothetical protein